MRKGVIALLVMCVLGLLGLVFWQLEYHHISLVLILLVVFAFLWCCVQVAVSLGSQRRRKSHQTMSRKRGSRSQWLLPLSGAVVIAIIGIVLWQLGFETTGQLFWFLVVVALLWCCVQASLLLQPNASRNWRGYGQESDASGNLVAPQIVHDRLFPGSSSLASGTYNEGNEKVWDGNESLPPH